MARYIGGFPAKGNDLNYTDKLLFLTRWLRLLFHRGRTALTLGRTATIHTAAFDRLGPLVIPAHAGIQVAAKAGGCPLSAGMTA